MSYHGHFSLNATTDLVKIVLVLNEMVLVLAIEIGCGRGFKQEQEYEQEYEQEQEHEQEHEHEHEHEHEEGHEKNRSN